MSRSIVLCLAALTAAVTISTVQAQDSPWTFVCRDKHCMRIFKEELQGGEVATTVEVCKLNCGDFGSLWPKPTGLISLSKDVQPISATIAFDMAGIPTGLQPWLNELDEVFASYLAKMNPSGASSNNPNAAQVTVSFQITNDSKHLGLSTDESYSLTLNSPSEAATTIRIVAPTYFGARHALETASQLIAYNTDSQEYVIVKSANIVDNPVYKYRGLTLDTSRNFVSMARLHRLVDGLSYNKLNTFHWHITDSNSFPIEITGQPNLTRYGVHTPDKIYTIPEVRELIEYAKIRGVKIVPEFDQPAHVGNGWVWGADQKDKLAVCVEKDYWHQWCVQPPCGQLNVINEEIYTIIGDIYKSMLALFDHDIFHMGGDEVDFRCYNSTQPIIDWMAARGWGRDLDSFLKLWDYFQTKSYEKLVAENSVTDFLAILWTSELTSEHYIKEYIDNTKYAVQIWTEGADSIVKFLIENRYKVIFSNVDAWYLDCGFQNWILDSGYNWCSPYKTWQIVYENSPYKLYARQSSNAAADQAMRDGLILGGSAPLWLEQADGDTIESRFWPRGAALGERLWTDPRTTGVREATVRMVTNRQRLVQRGLQADALKPEWCYQHEDKCTGEGLDDNGPEPSGAGRAGILLMGFTMVAAFQAALAFLV